MNQQLTQDHSARRDSRLPTKHSASKACPHYQPPASSNSTARMGYTWESPPESRLTCWGTRQRQTGVRQNQAELSAMCPGAHSAEVGSARDVQSGQRRKEGPDTGSLGWTARSGGVGKGASVCQKARTDMLRPLVVHTGSGSVSLSRQPRAHLRRQPVLALPSLEVREETPVTQAGGWVGLGLAWVLQGV